MDREDQCSVDSLYASSESSFERWEVIQHLVDEMIDMMLNYRQSGHPGGSRSKVHILLSLMLSGAMRWDILRPWRPFADRFVLSAGHTAPLVYACLAVLNECMRARHERDGEAAFAFPAAGKYGLTWEDLSAWVSHFYYKQKTYASNDGNSFWRDLSQFRLGTSYGFHSLARVGLEYRYGWIDPLDQLGRTRVPFWSSFADWGNRGRFYLTVSGSYN